MDIDFCAEETPAGQFQTRPILAFTVLALAQENGTLSISNCLFLKIASSSQGVESEKLPTNFPNVEGVCNA
jgi:hypothetical protein